MAVTSTDIRNTRESARRIRFEKVGGIVATDVQTAIEQVATTPPSVVGVDVNVGMSPYPVTPTDKVLYVDTSGGPVTIVLPAPALRNGQALTIKDVTGNAAANNITVSGQTIDGIVSPNYKIASDFGGIQLYPRTADYTVAP